MRVLLMISLLAMAFSATAEDCDALVDAFDNAAAARCFQARLEADPKNAALRISFMRALIDAGEDAGGASAEDRFLEALIESESFIEGWPESAEGYYYKAVAMGRYAQFLGGKKKVAMAHDIRENVDRALAIDPRHAEALLTRGIYFYELATLNRALRFFAKVLYGGLPEGGLDDARRDLELSLEVDPENSNTLYHLALVRHRLKDYENCADYCEAALALPVSDHRDPHNQALAADLLDKVSKKLKKRGDRR